MAKSKTSVFVSKSKAKEALTVKIDATLMGRIESLKKRLSEIAPELHFNVPEIVESAIEDAVQKGEQELMMIESTSTRGKKE